MFTDFSDKNSLELIKQFKKRYIDGHHPGKAKGKNRHQQNNRRKTILRNRTLYERYFKTTKGQLN